MRNWGLVYIGNFAGAMLIVLLMYYSGQWGFNDGMVGAQALLIANSKVNIAFSTAFVLGILANGLVCLAVWLCHSARSTTDKILAIIWPIAGFVALGFEHCIANMYFIPLGILLKSDPELMAGLGTSVGDMASLDLQGLAGNLVPVTLGNIVGGTLLVAGVYWFAYLKDFEKKP